MDAVRLHAQERRLEERLRAPEPLVLDRDDLPVRKLVRLLELRRRRSCQSLFTEVLREEAHVLDNKENLALTRRREHVSALFKYSHQVVRQVTASKVEPQDRVWEREGLEDRDRVRDTVALVKDDTRRTPRRIQRQDSLDADVHRRRVERLEHDLRHLLTVRLGVHLRPRQQDGVLLRRNTQLVEERVVPDLLHVVPVVDNPVLNGVLQCDDTTLRLRLVTDVRVLLPHTGHDRRMAGTANNRREDSARRVVTGETGLAHSGTVINNKRLKTLVSCEDQLLLR